MGAMLRPMIDGMQNQMAGASGANDPFTALARGPLTAGGESRKDTVLDVEKLSGWFKEESAG